MVWVREGVGDAEVGLGIVDVGLVTTVALVVDVVDIVVPCFCFA